MLKSLLLATLCLLLPGCGIILFPVSVPLSLAENHVIRLHCELIDDSGRPIPATQIELQKSTSVPNLQVSGLEAIGLTWFNYSKSTVTTSPGLLLINAWCSSISFKIAPDGYYPRAFQLDHNSMEEEIFYDGGSQFNGYYELPSQSLQRLVFDRVENPQKLLEQSILLGETQGGQITGSNIAPGPDGKIAEQSFNPSTDPLPKNAIYLTIQRNPNGNFDRSTNPQSYESAPRSITLHCTSKDGGFIRIPYKNGHPVNGHIRHAPTTGYQPEITLTENDIRNDHVPMQFYIKSGSLYGYFTLHKSYAHADQQKFNTPDDQINFSIQLHLQPNGTTNIEAPPKPIIGY